MLNGSDEYDQLKLNHFYPEEVILKIVEDLPYKEVEYYQLLLKLPPYPNEIDQITAWKSSIADIFAIKTHSLTVALSEMVFTHVKTIEGRIVNDTDDKEFKSIQTIFRNKLRQTIMERLTDPNLIAEMLGSAKDEERTLRDIYGKVVIQFSQMIHPSYFLYLFHELSVAKHYGIPEDFEDVEHWMNLLMENPGRLTEIADEVIFSLKRENKLPVEDLEVLRKGVLLILKDKKDAIVKEIKTYRNLNFYNKMREEITKIDQNAEMMTEALFRGIEKKHRALLIFLKNGFYEKWKKSRDVENEILTNALQSIPELRTLYKEQPDQRLKIVMLLRYSLKTLSPNYQKTADLKDLMKKIDDLMSYQSKMNRTLRNLRIHGSKDVQDYLIHEKYLQDKEGFDKEYENLEITIIALRVPPELHIVAKKQLLMIKLGLFLSSNFEALLLLFNQYKQSATDNHLEYAREHFSPSDEIMAWIKIFYRMLPDKLKLAYPIQTIAPEIGCITLRLIDKVMDELKLVVTTFQKQLDFEETLQTDKNRLEQSILKLIKEGRLNIPFSELTGLSVLQIKLLQEIIQSIQQGDPTPY